MTATKKGHKGGRGCKARYSSSTVRVPDPIRGEVEKLIAGFHKPVTSNEINPQANYWDWNQPERFEVCPELTRLLALSRPDNLALSVLQHLGDKNPPFFKKDIETRQSGQFIAISGFMDSGHFAQYDQLWECREEYIDAFCAWVDKTSNQCTEQEFESILKVCFNAYMDRFKEVIQLKHIGSSPWRILGVKRGVSREDLKKAYRIKTKEVHPDTGGSKEAFHAVRQAYEELLKTCHK